MGIAAEALERRKVACDAALVCDADGSLGKDRQVDEANSRHAVLRIGGTLALLCRAKVHDARKPVPIAQQLDVLVRRLVQVTGTDEPAYGYDLTIGRLQPAQVARVARSVQRHVTKVLEPGDWVGQFGTTLNLILRVIHIKTPPSHFICSSSHSLRMTAWLILGSRAA